MQRKSILVVIDLKNYTFRKGFEEPSAVATHRTRVAAAPPVFPNPSSHSWPLINSYLHQPRENGVEHLRFAIRLGVRENYYYVVVVVAVIVIVVVVVIIIIIIITIIISSWNSS